MGWPATCVPVWLAGLLALAGDVETNPGPQFCKKCHVPLYPHHHHLHETPPHLLQHNSHNALRHLSTPRNTSSHTTLNQSPHSASHNFSPHSSPNHTSHRTSHNSPPHLAFNYSYNNTSHNPTAHHAPHHNLDIPHNKYSVHKTGIGPLKSATGEILDDALKAGSLNSYCVSCVQQTTGSTTPSKRGQGPRR